MSGFTAGHAVARLAEVIGRSIDVVIYNNPPLNNAAVLEQYAREHKMPLPLGQLPPNTKLIEGSFWRGTIARHDRRRLRGAVWTALADCLLSEGQPVQA